MKVKLLIFFLIFIAMVGCSSSPGPSQAPFANTPLPTAISSPARTSSPTSTPTPFPTSTPFFSPIVSITPGPGFKIWEEQSKPGIYTIQYPVEAWLEKSGQLTHATVNHCLITEYGGNDMCMAGGCPEQTNITLGDVVFQKMAFGNNSHAIYTSGSRFALSFEVYSPNDSRCVEEAEKVLNTLQIRPERGCIDRAAFVADVTVPDNTVMPPETRFIKTWRLKNAGTCPWTKQYTLEVHGTSSGTEADWVALQENVQPQQTVDLSIELPAPPFVGIARWEAVLKNEFGDSFGPGSDPYTEMFGKPFWVQIIVGPASPP